MKKAESGGGTVADVNIMRAHVFHPVMKIRASAVLLLGCLLQFSTPLRAELHYKGSVVEGRQTLVMISSSNGFSKWCAPGDVVEGFKVQSVSADGNELVVLGSDGKPATLKLETAKVKLAASDDGLIPLDQLNWKWIKSDENPMRKMPEDLPGWATDSWATVPTDIKLDILNYFRAHGWGIKVTGSKAEGRVHVSATPLRDPSERQPTFEELKASGKLVPAGSGMPAKSSKH